MDSTAAIERVKTDTIGPGQRFAIAAMEVCTRLLAKENQVTIRWAPARHGVPGNERADEFAKAAIGPYLKDKIRKTDDDRCWWYGEESNRPATTLQSAGPGGPSSEDCGRIYRRQWVEELKSLLGQVALEEGYGSGYGVSGRYQGGVHSHKEAPGGGV